jgi:hypothetical protein
MESAQPLDPMALFDKKNAGPWWVDLFGDDEVKPGRPKGSKNKPKVEDKNGETQERNEAREESGPGESGGVASPTTSGEKPAQSSGTTGPLNPDESGRGSGDQGSAVEPNKDSGE